MKQRQMSMQEIAGFLLSGNDETDDVTETGSDTETNSATQDAPEIKGKRKRGRPSKSGQAMTAAERSRRYRLRRSGMWGMQRVELWVDTVSKLEQLAAENGYRIEAVVDFALAGVSKDYWRELRMDRLKESEGFIDM